MKKKYPGTGGGFKAVKYSLKMAKKSGSIRKFVKTLNSSNVCKTCALGMKGMKNELGEGFQVCKKSMQAIAQDLQKGIDESLFSNFNIQDFTNLGGRKLENLGRLVNPIYKETNSNYYKIISWQEAYQKVQKILSEIVPNNIFVYVSGRSSNEAGYLINLLARQLGTNNINNCSYYCHQATGVGLKQAIGSGTSTVTLEDVMKTELVVLIGANPSSNHPRFISHLVDIRKKGGAVVVINPFVESGLKEFKLPSRPKSLLLSSKISDLYIQPHAGGDMALLKALVVKLNTENKIDEDFLKKHCQNWEELRIDLENSSIDQLLEFSGVKQEDFDELYNYLISRKKIIFSWAMGITHQHHGVETVRMLTNLALVLGQVGNGEGKGLLPLRGHSNVQGIGSVGVVPKLTPEIIQLFHQNFDIPIITHEGLDTFSCMEAADAGNMKTAIMLGGNLYSSNPNSAWAKQAMNKLDHTIYINTTLNLGHFEGIGKESLVLPVRTRDEDRQETTQESMFNYVRLSEGGISSPSNNLPTEVELLSKIGKGLFGNTNVPWSELSDHTKLRNYISKTIPYLKSLSDITAEKGEFTIPGRIKHIPDFNTENNKAVLFVGNPPDSRPSEGYFNLITFRSEGQFNTIIYEDEDLYRGVSHRMVIFINTDDIIRLGVNEGDYVLVESKVSSMKLQVITGPIRSGNVAMYFPEGNQLVVNSVDAQSKTPAFKNTKVKIKLLNN
ncbi:MAG: FdhF/YdeP family oxidoreductase [Candidatus Heimdallarchaeota archaeon]|nr:FdhF/YdeP family oxidoreductase [Candidatus Heimdallarchaeota archaeon]MDH5645690.1 FdhF/YdeP family oxidoreductase [Candidatus Heimdallarchaeota archaeon]